MQIDGRAHIGFMTAEFFLPNTHSLKEKRSVMKRLRSRVSKEFNVSVSETGYQDKWQRSQWAFCIVSSDLPTLDREIQQLLDFLRAGEAATLTDYHLEHF